MSEENDNFNQDNDLLINIRSKYITKRIFSYLKQSKLLSIMQYNKKYQKLMNIKLEDYKNEFFKIEIEVIPKENSYGKFINADLNKSIHIYFNDNEKEIKKKKITKKDNVKKIKIIFDNKIKSLAWFFSGCKCIKKINFIKFNKDDIKDIFGMFSGCTSLEELNISNFNTNKITNMSFMFSGCSSLNELNLSNFNTNNVTNMSYMFNGCSSLNKLNLSNFNTNKVTNMSYMFFGCSSGLSLICKDNQLRKEYKNNFLDEDEEDEDEDEDDDDDDYNSIDDNDD